MMDEDSEKVYSQFMLSEHQTSSLPQGESSLVSTKSGNISKYTSVIRDNELSRILGAIVRLVIRRAPFPTRYEDIRNLVKAHVPYKQNSMLASWLLDEAKKLTSNIFGLTLCDVRLPGGKREVFLKQSLAFHPHDLKITNEGDHELRGFLLLLVPCLKAYTSGIPLDRLCNIFSQIGKGHMVPHDKESEESLLSVLRSPRRRRDVKFRSSDFRHISDYLVYARDLGYIQFQADSTKSDGCNTLLVCAGYRFVLEFDQASYLAQFNTLEMDPNIKRSLSVFFDT